MSLHVYTSALLWAIPSLMITSLVLIHSGLRATSWLLLETHEQMRFHKPRQLRAGALAIGLCMGCLGGLTFILESTARHSHTFPSENPTAIFFAMMVWVGLALMFLSLSGPSNLSLDAKRRTYHWRWGAPWSPHVRTGTWDDLSGVVVSRYKGGATVTLRWKGSIRMCTMGKFKKREEADIFATQIADKLALPRVSPPPTPQMRDIFYQ